MACVLQNALRSAQRLRRAAGSFALIDLQCRGCSHHVGGAIYVGSAIYDDCAIAELKEGLTLAPGCMITVGQKGKSTALRSGTYAAPSRCRDATPLMFSCLMDSVPLRITFRMLAAPAKSSVLGPSGTAQTTLTLLTAAVPQLYVLAVQQQSQDCQTSFKACPYQRRW